MSIFYPLETVDVRAAAHTFWFVRNSFSIHKAFERRNTLRTLLHGVGTLLIAIGIALLVFGQLNRCAYALNPRKEYKTRSEEFGNAAGKLFLGSIASFALAYLVRRIEEKNEEKTRERSRKHAAADTEERGKVEYATTQRQLRESIENCLSSAETAVTEIKIHIADAECALREAEREFAEGAFAPFWDAVERAANRLAQSDLAINRIVGYSKSYRHQVAKLDSWPPPFRPGIDTLPDTTRAVAMMRAIVRSAQKDFHFASIYEQRKTNKLLIDGFTNLADALGRMGERLQSSIDALADSVLELAETNRATTDVLVSGIASFQETMESDAGARREHEEKQREMLDNIQRGRKPRNVFPKTFD